MHSESATAPGTSPRTTRPKITESLWFWIYLFSTASLIALILLGPKINSRQKLDYRNYQGRQQSYENAQRPDNPSRITSDTSSAITTTPLLIGIGFIFVFSWGMLWYQRFVKKWPHTTVEPATTTAADTLVHSSQLEDAGC